MRTRRLTALVLACSLLSQPAFAGPGGGSLSLSQELPNLGGGSEYVSGNYPGAVLMPINLWGAVGKPGIHHIPTQTDLVTLLSLAGGPGADALMDRITIKRRSNAEEQVIRVDAEELLTKPGMHSPVLEANDIIIIPRDKPTINPNTVTTLGFVGSVVGLILAGVALNQAFKK